MTYQEALAYLEQASSFGIKPGLERITALMDVLGNPQEDYKIVHVTGTNGKGSVTRIGRAQKSTIAPQWSTASLIGKPLKMFIW